LGRYKEVLAVWLEPAHRAVGEPDVVPLRFVTRHVARKHDVVKNDQPARGVVAEEADVGGERVGRRKVPDDAVAVDIDVRRRNRGDLTIDHAAEIGNATEGRLRPRRSGGEQREYAGEQQDCDPLAAYSHTNCATKSHVRLVPVTGQFVAGRD